MKQYLVDLIKFNKRVSQQEVSQQPPEPMSSKSVQPAQKQDSLFRPPLAISERETLRLYRAMDLAG